jgi:ATP-dependent RNA helicase RhlB
VEGKTRFQDLDLPPEIMHAIADLGFQYCTPIQAGALPHLLQGRDLFGRAQTGTGKTAAFLLTMFAKFLRNPISGERRPGTPRALVLAPTRELVIQIEKDARELAKYTPFEILAVFGGMDYDKQRRILRERHLDLVVATPGRLLDYKKKQDLHLSRVEVLVIDEADRMLDMGFIPDVREIVHSTPHKGQRQTLFLSATLTDDVKRLGNQWTKDPASIDIEPEQVAVDTVHQVVYIVTLQDKFALLHNVLTRQTPDLAIVFINRRDEGTRLSRELLRHGVDNALLSGAVPQERRIKILENFRSGKVKVLVATDVAGRGLHVTGISHVINYNLPIDPEDYVHRIGRTGRAGASGISISFADEDDGTMIPQIEAYIGRPLPCTHPEDEWLVPPKPVPGVVLPDLKEYRDFRGGPRRGGGGGPRRGGGGRGGPRGGRGGGHGGRGR